MVAVEVCFLPLQQRKVGWLAPYQSFVQKPQCCRQRDEALAFYLSIMLDTYAVNERVSSTSRRGG
jgi:hypothetical protein